MQFFRSSWLGLALLLAAWPNAHAASITSTKTGSGALNASGQFQWETASNRTVQANPTGWVVGSQPYADSRAFGPSNFSMVIPNLLPVGDILTSATLDVAVVLALQSATPQLTRTQNTVGNNSGSQASSFNPTFSNTFTGQLVSIQAGSATITFAPGTTSLTGLNLFSDVAFRTALQAGSSVQVNWTQSLSMTGTWPDYSSSNSSPNRCRNCTKVYTVTQVLTSNSNAILSLGYKAPGAVPEPSSFVLFGLGAGFLWVTARRREVPTRKG